MSEAPNTPRGAHGAGPHGQQPSCVRMRQQQLYDGLWKAGRRGALSPDRIRFRVWRPYLRAPLADVGAGDALLARSFPELATVSVDLSDTGLRHAPGSAVVGAAEAIPLADACMRTVVLSEVLEHAEHPAAVLSECRRVLAHDGRLLLSTPLWPIAPAAFAFFRHRIGERPDLANLGQWDPQHERRFLLDDLLAHVTEAGFSVERTVPLFGSASSAVLFVVEPIVARVVGRSVPLAHVAARLDPVLRPLDRPSAVALVCRPSPTP